MGSYIDHVGDVNTAFVGSPGQSSATPQQTLGDYFTVKRLVYLLSFSPLPHLSSFTFSFYPYSILYFDSSSSSQHRNFSFSFSHSLSLGTSPYFPRFWRLWFSCKKPISKNFYAKWEFNTFNRNLKKKF